MEQEKRFKIEKIEKYNKEINHEKMSSTLSCVNVGMFTLLTIVLIKLGI